MGMDSLTVYDVEERVPVHGEHICIFRYSKLVTGRVDYPSESDDKGKYKEDYYEININHELYKKGMFTKYLLEKEVAEILRQEQYS
jgi:hypothetical protein